MNQLMIFGFIWQKILLRLLPNKALFINDSTFGDLLSEYIYREVRKCLNILSERCREGCSEQKLSRKKIDIFHGSGLMEPWS